LALRPLVAGVVQVPVLLVTVVAGLSFAPFYGGAGWLPPLAGAAVLGVAVGWLASLLRWRWWLTTPAAAVLFLLCAVYAGYRDLTVYGLPGPDALRAVGEDLVSGWARMLTVALPADVDGELLVTPLALTFLAALAGSLLARNSSRITLLALPALLLYVAGLLFTATRPAPRLVLTGGFLLCLLLLVLVRSNRVPAASVEPAAVAEPELKVRGGSVWGRMAFGLPVIAMVAAAGTGVAWVLPVADGSERADPRALVERRFQLSTLLTPLALVKPQLETDPPAELFTVQITRHNGDVTIDRVRVAALDSFDGAVWSQSRDFVITGSVLPEGSPLDPPVVTVDLDVDVAQLPTPFLPVIGQPVRVAADEVAFDPLGGTLVSTRPAVLGYQYRLTAQVRPVDDSLGRALVSQTPADRAYTELPDAPSWLYDEARRITSGLPTPDTQLLAIEAYLQEFRYSVAARPGHSYGAVRRVLQGQADNEAGSAEQFASAFAMLARASGYPARVAVGYRLSDEKRTGDEYHVDSSDAHAWPEVHFAGLGWVAFEPTNTDNPETDSPPRETTAPELPADESEQPRQPDVDAVQGGTEVAGGGFAPKARRAALVVAAILLAVLGILFGVVLAKSLRRLRRARHGTAPERIAAAWRETTDRLRERGVRAPPTLTPTQVSRAAAVTGTGARAADQLAELALIVTTAVCAPYEPPDEAARRSWQLEVEIRRALYRGAPVAVRVRALFDPRPLLPGRRAGTGQAEPVPAGTNWNASAGVRPVEAVTGGGH
jgi:transglutaminase-like putative cysteine protease